MAGKECAVIQILIIQTEPDCPVSLVLWLVNSLILLKLVVILGIFPLTLWLPVPLVLCQSLWTVSTSSLTLSLQWHLQATTQNIGRVMLLSVGSFSKDCISLHMTLFVSQESMDSALSPLGSGRKSPCCSLCSCASFFHVHFLSFFILLQIITILKDP